jgi:hypothetical protein
MYALGRTFIKINSFGDVKKTGGGVAMMYVMVAMSKCNKHEA